MKPNNEISFMSGTEFCFLPITTLKPSNRREAELRLANARSHLATTTHRRKKSSTKKKNEDIGRSDQTNCQIQRRLTPILPCVVPDKILDQHTRMLLHYCTQSFWPGFETGSAAFHIPSFARDYNTLVSQGPGLVHALLWSAAVSLSYRRNARVTDKDSLIHYNQALKYISEDIARPLEEISEQTMYAILSISGSEVSPNDGEDIVRRAFDPPLAELSWIHVYGRRLHIDAHARALIRIVDLKGGIHNLRSLDFQASFNYMDLTRASQRLIRPRLPISKLYGRVKETHDRRKVFGYATDFSPGLYAEETTNNLNRLSELGLAATLEEVVYDLRVWVKVIEAYHFGLLTNPDSSLLTAHRDLIQQRLLSTLPEEADVIDITALNEASDARNQAAEWINELIQTALLIFSLGVTFPIPYAPPYHRLSKRLKARLEQCMEEAFELQLFDVLTWLGMLGVLCSEQVGNNLRVWFISFLSTVETKRIGGGVTRDWFIVVKQSLEPFLWSTVSCDAAAEVAWKEVQAGSRGWERTAWSGILGTICG
ncbi:hypothetical protein FSPOR_9232 [Fusarium sporotrichioides]|uniref:Uncharacterized protein n=1 Tax=Fusarium sporotrichioides TaxID=5514 RepID=A0A395RS68_FUSSP|nr:hypothetical protein FSPOR_9232 [Fusarium sporotrichioides]